jgi:hypothetical protein
LHSNGGVTLGIESGRTPQDFGGDLVFLQGDSGMIDRMLGEIAEQFAQGLGAVKAMAFCKLLYLLEALGPTNRERVCYSHMTWA